MKIFILFIIIVFFLFSCKKEKPYNPDDHITYTHWYKTRSDSTDSMSYSIAVPNAFSPNGDGINDYFIMKGTAIINSFSMKIYSRNGDLVYSGDDFYKGWNGKINAGSTAPIGVYIFEMELAEASGRSSKYQGSVTIFR